MGRVTGDLIYQMYQLRDAGLSNKQISEKVHVSEGHVSHYCSLRKYLDKGEMPPDSTNHSKQACPEYIEKYVKCETQKAHDTAAKPKEENRRMKYKVEVIVWEYQ